MKTVYIDAGATISADERYRYHLWREWRGTHDPDNWRWLGAKDGAAHELGHPKSCVFVMLNPSTADGKKDDPTIRSCVRIAKHHRFERLEVVNLFAYRATDPRQLLNLCHEDDPVGWENQEAVEKALDHAGLVICAWGAHGGHRAQDETVMGWIESLGRKMHCLGLTKAGKPKHPLFLLASTPLVRL